MKLEPFVIGALGDRSLHLSIWLKSEGFKFRTLADEAAEFWKRPIGAAKAAYGRYITAKPLKDWKLPQS